MAGEPRPTVINEAQRHLDAMGAQKIAVAPIPDHGLGQAINDRLRRAAAPRLAG